MMIVRPLWALIGIGLILILGVVILASQMPTDDEPISFAPLATTTLSASSSLPIEEKGMTSVGDLVGSSPEGGEQLESVPVSALAPASTPAEPAEAPETETSSTSKMPPATLEEVAKLLKETERALADYTGPRIEASELSEKDMDLQAVVLVRCVYFSQYFAASSQPANEVIATLGSGVIVNSSGYILTAAHVVRDKSFGPDESGRIFSFDHCDISRTTNYRTVIDAKKPGYKDVDPLFQTADIVFEPDEDSYRDSAGMDVAVLRPVKPQIEEHYSQPLGDMVSLPTDVYSVIAVGYPGKDVLIPQDVERFDGAFVGMAGFEGSSCLTSKLADVCGWRYVIARIWDDVKQYEGFFTDYGKISAQARQGFSGGPAFYKGNLIGIITHGYGRMLQGGQTFTERQLDTFEILTSRDIVAYLSNKGISL
ncbi:trypsin-like peptidase domain-containing protein [Candidatus Kaiserbacteria bacterium]|nr:trypsin-like peptidase domain-containing protein [Candidatus Kaiserbacteria bacterium]